MPDDGGTMFAETVNILGTDWTIKVMDKHENKALKVMDGYCDYTTHIIVIDKFNGKPNPAKKQDREEYRRSCLRHEIIHAFLYESGLAHCSLSPRSWAMNEEMVDWIAQQHTKIHAAYIEAGAI